VEEELAAADLSLSLKAKQGRMAEIGFERVAEGVRLRFSRVLLDTDGTSELIADRARVRIRLEVFEGQRFEIRANLQHRELARRGTWTGRRAGDEDTATAGQLKQDGVPRDRLRNRADRHRDRAPAQAELDDIEESALAGAGAASDDVEGAGLELDDLSVAGRVVQNDCEKLHRLGRYAEQRKDGGRLIRFGKPAADERRLTDELPQFAGGCFGAEMAGEG